MMDADANPILNLKRTFFLGTHWRETPTQLGNRPEPWMADSGKEKSDKYGMFSE